jgi:hypothetical protein
MTNSKTFEDVKRIMGALVRQPPKPHGEMKLGKKKRKTVKKKPAERGSGGAST